MRTVLDVAYLALLLFFILLLVRLVLDWVMVFARSWRPTGVALVVAEATYTVTDPPLRLLRRVIPPLRIGAISLDLAFMVLFLLCTVGLSLLG
ncbi:YggT family protein [Cellulomonas rhizosphaerae]|uniref:YggT family protein n=1 Tax=Cellulomonas rhizosphaerae TaxID=2293719 RepID=A0A413RMQ5_9CELL|nr:YggT family protein [Cellulomonas rhizosphaerae]RHA42017.1 YggT family protein [Cellulomonas rhizosphaerae]